MTIRKEIVKLGELGSMPNASDDNIADETIDVYCDLLHNIKTSVNYEEAEILVKLFPKEGLYEIEWTLLHIFESVYPKIEETQYMKLIEQCPSKEWLETLTKRLGNWKTRNSGR